MEITFKKGAFFFSLCLSCLLPFGCASPPEAPLDATPLPGEVTVAAPQDAPKTKAKQGGLAEEIRSLTETGTPSSLEESLSLIRERELGGGEFGRAMNAVNSTLIKTVYPALQTQLPLLDPPQAHAYARILAANANGVFTPPPPEKQADYLEHVLPFLAIYSGGSGEAYLQAIPVLREAAGMKSDSVLAPCFLGLAFERSGDDASADGEYRKAWSLADECYPAGLGIARLLEKGGDVRGAVAFLQDMVIRSPDNSDIKRALACVYYRSGDWSRAEPAIAEILQRNPRDGEFILMRARVMVERGQYLQAQAPLDLYAQINPNNRMYLFLRARVQAEGYRNRDAALNYLRSLVRNPGGAGDDDEISVYAARLLLESSRPEDQAEGRGLLARLMTAEKPSLAVVSLALEDATRRGAWDEARPLLDRLLKERRSPPDLYSAYVVERGQGNNAAALSYARELHERDKTNEDGAVAYISALIDTGRQDEAAAMIDGRLSSLQGGALKSRYYYLRSRTRPSEDQAMSDLRSSLFEDPRNLDALIAMFGVYHRRRDDRRAVYYLKQALAISPEDPRLKTYEEEYAGQL